MNLNKSSFGTNVRRFRPWFNINSKSRFKKTTKKTVMIKKNPCSIQINIKKKKTLKYQYNLKNFIFQYWKCGSYMSHQKSFIMMNLWPRKKIHICRFSGSKTWSCWRLFLLHNEHLSVSAHHLSPHICSSLVPTQWTNKHTLMGL